MDYEQQMTQLQGTLAVMVEIQQQQAEVQKMQAHSLVVHERRMNEMVEVQKMQAEGQAIHDQRMAELRKMLAEGFALHEQLHARQAEGLAIHEGLLGELKEGYALHEQRMSHIDMRLAEITDKLDGMIGFMDGFTRRPQ